jgi:hypothetical protein
MERFAQMRRVTINVFRYGRKGQSFRVMRVDIQQSVLDKAFVLNGLGRRVSLIMTEKD